MKVFELLVYAIVAVVLILIAITLFNAMFPKENLLLEIKQGLVTAQTETYLGQTIELGQRSVEKEYTINKSFFDTSQLSLAFECNNPNLCCIRKAEQDINYKCTKAVEWDYTNLTFNFATQAKINLRCIKQDDLPVCRVYFGSKPAQAEVTEINFDQLNEIVTATVKAKNSGENNLAQGKMNLVLEKLVNFEWKETEEEFPEQVIETETDPSILMPGQEHSFVWATRITTPGTYRAVFTFEGQNAGFDKNSADFDVGFNSYCKPLIESTYEVREEDNGLTFKEIKKCGNCNYAYECASAWQTKFPNINYEVLTKDTTYCLKESLGSSSCESESS